MSVRILFFAQLAELFDTKEMTMQDINSTSQLIAALQTKNALFKNYTYLMAVEKNIVNTDTPLQDGTVVALLPPFSGG